MIWDPHTLHLILQRIRQQMRCPQCGGKVPVEFTSVRMTGDDFLLMQLKCEACDAYIVLHASLQSLTKGVIETEPEKTGVNASTQLCSEGVDVGELRKALASTNGSFGSLIEPTKETDIA